MKRLTLYILLLFGLYLGLHGENLALFDSNSAKPTHIFPYRAALYPKIDQAQLRDGIPVESEEHLKRLLEDFLS